MSAWSLLYGPSWVPPQLLSCIERSSTAAQSATRIFGYMLQVPIIFGAESLDQ